MSSDSNNIPGLIYIMGIDGSGKSTVSEFLAKKLRDEGYDVEVMWLRFNHVFSKPLLGLCRLLKLTRYETCDGIRVGYHDFYKSSLISYAFIFFQYLDAIRVKYFKILPRCRGKNKILILDRYVYDILIDISVDTRKSNILSSWIGRGFKKLLPEDALNILVHRELDEVLGVRPEGKVDRNFESRYWQFKKLINDSSVNTINNSGSLEELLESALCLTGLKNEREAAR